MEHSSSTDGYARDNLLSQLTGSLENFYQQVLGTLPGVKFRVG